MTSSPKRMRSLPRFENLPNFAVRERMLGSTHRVDARRCALDFEKFAHWLAP